jgi:hypothetical protein
MYVDGARNVLTEVRCGSQAAGGGFECSAALPVMTPGAHTLELATLVQEPTGPVESEKSEPLRIVIAGGGITTPAPPTRITTRDGLNLSLAQLAGGLQLPSDIALPTTAPCSWPSGAD